MAAYLATAPAPAPAPAAPAPPAAAATAAAIALSLPLSIYLCSPPLPPSRHPSLPSSLRRAHSLTRRATQNLLRLFRFS
jgi:hypothetical protein